jgi:hypothetical protein
MGATEQGLAWSGERRKVGSGAGGAWPQPGEKKISPAYKLFCGFPD